MKNLILSLLGGIALAASLSAFAFDVTGRDELNGLYDGGNVSQNVCTLWPVFSICSSYEYVPGENGDGDGAAGDGAGPGDGAGDGPGGQGDGAEGCGPN